jgi:DNA-binding CsgD family transcriptional regulator
VAHGGSDDRSQRGGRDDARDRDPRRVRAEGVLGFGKYEQEFAAAMEFHGDQSGFERARTQLCLGMRRRRSRRRRDARAVLHEALSYFETEGAEPWAQQARSELRATGETPVPAANVSLSELTPQELQVAMSVAQGARNKEVAASLFLSARTVEFHLGNAYRKLGIRSRTELARRVEGLP